MKKGLTIIAKRFNSLVLQEKKKILVFLTSTFLVLSVLQWHFPDLFPEFLSYQYSPLLIIPTAWAFLRDKAESSREIGFFLVISFLLLEKLYRWDPLEKIFREQFSPQLFGLGVKVFNRFDLAFYYLAFFFGTLLLLKYQAKINEKLSFAVSAFLLFLKDLFQIDPIEEFLVNHFSTNFLEGFYEYSEKLHLPLFYLTLFWGIKIFWQSRRKIEEGLLREEEAHKKQEERRRQEFQKKSSASSSQLKVDLRKILSWFHREGGRYILCLLLVTLLALGLRLAQLGERNLQNDEFMMFDAATTYSLEKEYYQWNWLEGHSTKQDGCPANATTSCRYVRAWPHTWMIAQSFNLFGISEWSARLPSALFGTLLVLISYFWIRFFTGSKKLALLVATAFAIHPKYIDRSQTVRMYMVLMPLFLVISWLFYLGIARSCSLKSKLSKKFREKYLKYFDFDFKYLISGFALLILSFQIHLNALIILAIGFIFVLLMSFYQGKPKYYLATGIGLAGAALILIRNLFKEQLGEFAKFIIFRKLENYTDPFAKTKDYYLEILTHFPLGESLGLVFLILGMLTLLIIKKHHQGRALWLATTILTALPFFVYLADRQASYNYIAHITPFSILIILLPIFVFLQFLATPLLKKIGYLALFLILLGNLLIKADSLYLHPLQNYSQGFSTIEADFDPENEIIFGDYLRDYYFAQYFPSDTPVIKIGDDEKDPYPLSKFKSDLREHPSGWVMWPSKKDGHVNKEVRAYICQNFRQIHGETCREKKDDSEIEVFHFKNHQPQ